MTFASQFIVVLTSYTATFLIAVVGLALAIAKRPRSRGLVTAAMAILLVKVLIGAAWQLAVVPYMMENSGGGPALTMGYTVYGIADQLMLVAVWVLVLVALFRRGDTAPASPAPPYQGAGGPAPAWGYARPGAPGQGQGPAPGQEYGQGPVPGQDHGPGAASAHGAPPAPQYGPGPGAPAGQEPGPYPGHGGPPSGGEYGTGPRPAPGPDYGPAPGQGPDYGQDHGRP